MRMRLEDGEKERETLRQQNEALKKRVVQLEQEVAFDSYASSLPRLSRTKSCAAALPVRLDSIASRRERLQRQLEPVSSHSSC